MNYGKVVRMIRSMKDITQKRLSELTGYDMSYISRIESEERIPSLKALNVIAKSLNVPANLFHVLAEVEDKKGKREEVISQFGTILLDVLCSK